MEDAFVNDQHLEGLEEIVMVGLEREVPANQVACVKGGP